MTSVISLEGLPPELAKWVKPVLEECSFMIPSWIEDLSFQYAPTDKSVMFVRVCYRNRFCTIFLTGNTLAFSEIERRHALIHELVHVLLCPFSDTVNMATKTMSKKQRSIFKELFEDSLEAACEDTARAFLRAPPKGLKPND